MDAIKYLKEAERMCNSFEDCVPCPLRTNAYYCALHDIESVAIVEKWSEEHPQKTRAQDFLEKYPKAMLRKKEGTPVACCRNLGYCKNCCGHCRECWNQPID